MAWINLSNNSTIILLFRISIVIFIICCIVLSYNLFYNNLQGKLLGIVYIIWSLAVFTTLFLKSKMEKAKE